MLVELDDAVLLGILHPIGEDGGAIAVVSGAGEELRQIMTEEEIVAEDQRRAVAADEIGADRISLREAFRPRLLRVLETESPLPTVAQQLTKARQMLRGRDYENLANAGQHQSRDRVVDHRLVVDR